MSALRPWTIPVAFVFLLGTPPPAPAQPVDTRDTAALAYKHFLKARQLEKEKKLDDARREAADAVRLAPKIAPYLAYRGHLENRCGNPADGARYGLEAVQLSPSDSLYKCIVMEGGYASMNDTLARAYAAEVLKAGPKKVDPRDVRFAEHILDILTVHRYKLEWTVDGRRLNVTEPRVRLMLPLPAKTPYQDRTYELTGALEQTLVSKNGDDALEVVMDSGALLTLTATVVVKPYNFSAVISKYRNSTVYPADVQPFLGKSHRIDPTHPRVARIASTLKARTPLATVKNVLRWLDANISYKARIGSKFNNFDVITEILDRKNTKCDGYSALFVGLCRAAGVPAREVWGFSKGGAEFVPPGHLCGHAWAEFYLSGAGWVVLEPQEISDLGHAQIDRVEMVRQDPDVGLADRRELVFLPPKYTELK